ncbi:hypothetical protein DIPPA_17132 [Diplonema papillatum]|nr:hypothetical protein DIPPA_17132 [Diplonema papillatum]
MDIRVPVAGSIDDGGESLQDSVGNSSSTVIVKNVPPSSSDSEDDTCVVCLESMNDSPPATVCLIRPCEHRFHTACIHAFFKQCFIRKCPICRGEVESIHKDDCSEVAVADLRKLYWHQCYDIRFRSTPIDGPSNTPFGSEYTSFFTQSEETRTVYAHTAANESGQVIYRARLPAVVVELINSDSLPQTSHCESILVSLLHSFDQEQTSVTPDAVIMHNGVAIFDQIEIETATLGVHAVQFVADSPGLLVHRKAVFATLDLRVNFCGYWCGYRERRIWCRGAALCACLIVLTVLLIHFFCRWCTG